MDKSKSISRHKHPPTPPIVGLEPTGHVASSTTNASAGTNPADPKAKLTEHTKALQRAENQSDALPSSTRGMASRVRHRSMDPANVDKARDRHNKLNETLYELGFFFVGDEASRSEPDGKLAAGSHKAKRATPDEPQHSSAAPRGRTLGSSVGPAASAQTSKAGGRHPKERPERRVVTPEERRWLALQLRLRRANGASPQACCSIGRNDGVHREPGLARSAIRDADSDDGVSSGTGPGSEDSNRAS